MKDFLSLFNWKDHPANVFIFAIPLAMLAVTLLIAASIVAVVEKGDWIYMAITVVGLLVGIVALVPAAKMAIAVHKQNEN